MGTQIVSAFSNHVLWERCQELDVQLMCCSLPPRRHSPSSGPLGARPKRVFFVESNGALTFQTLVRSAWG